MRISDLKTKEVINICVTADVLDMWAMWILIWSPGVF